jgi:hypothetical protein
MLVTVYEFRKKKNVQKRYSDVELQGPDERKTLNDKHSKQGSKHGTKQKNVAQNKRHGTKQKTRHKTKDTAQSKRTRHKTKERGTKQIKTRHKKKRHGTMRTRVRKHKGMLRIENDVCT